MNTNVEPPIEPDGPVLAYPKIVDCVSGDGRLTVYFTAGGEYEVEIRTLRGETAYFSASTGYAWHGSLVLDFAGELSHLPAGLYTLRVAGDEGSLDAFFAVLR